MHLHFLRQLARRHSAWLLWLALLIPVAQAAVQAHVLSHGVAALQGVAAADDGLPAPEHGALRPVPLVGARRRRAGGPAADAAACGCATRSAVLRTAPGLDCAAGLGLPQPRAARFRVLTIPRPIPDPPDVRVGLAIVMTWNPPPCEQPCRRASRSPLQRPWGRWRSNHVPGRHGRPVQRRHRCAETGDRGHPRQLRKRAFGRWSSG